LKKDGKDRKAGTIVMVDDDLDDCMLVKEAFKEIDLPHKLIFMNSGEALLRYLYDHSKKKSSAILHPDLIFLDLNMSGKSGHDILRHIRSDPVTRRIPIIVMTTSSEERDISLSYELGASSHIIKPASFEELVDVVKSLYRYWFEIVTLPERKRSG
jgi:CheY-like chemotaxis protein